MSDEYKNAARGLIQLLEEDGFFTELDTPFLTVQSRPKLKMAVLESGFEGDYRENGVMCPNRGFIYYVFDGEKIATAPQADDLVVEKLDHMPSS